MGFQKRWDVIDLYNQIRAATAEVCSKYNDGYTAFYAKQEIKPVEPVKPEPKIKKTQIEE